MDVIVVGIVRATARPSLAVVLTLLQFFLLELLDAGRGPSGATAGGTLGKGGDWVRSWIGIVAACGVDQGIM